MKDCFLLHQHRLVCDNPSQVNLRTPHILASYDSLIFVAFPCSTSTTHGDANSEVILLLPFKILINQCQLE